MSDCVLCLGIEGNKLQSWEPDLRTPKSALTVAFKSTYPQTSPQGGGRNTSRGHPHPVLSPRTPCGWASVCLKWTPGEYGFGVAQLIKVPILFVLTNKIALSIFVMFWGLRCVLLSPMRILLQVCYATCLWNIFFSYLRDKLDLHFPLNTKWLCLFSPRISDIWSNSNLFSYLTSSNNWALTLAELVPTTSERKVRVSALCCRGTGGAGTCY